MYPLLGHITFGLGGYTLAQNVPLFEVQVCPKNRRFIRAASQRLDEQMVESLPRIIKRGSLAQPPSGNRRKFERLAKQTLAELRQIAQ